jgi:hypothetical protein
MNEKIKQLALDAGIGFTLWDDSGRAMIDNYTPEEHLAEFAELIVTECANHCDLLLDHKISSEWSRGTHDCSRAIKKHFGVEE